MTKILYVDFLSEFGHADFERGQGPRRYTPGLWSRTRLAEVARELEAAGAARAILMSWGWTLALRTPFLPTLAESIEWRLQNEHDEVDHLDPR